MRITETHANGASITVTGWNAQKVVAAWRVAQSPAKESEPEEEAPKVIGTSAIAERAAEDLKPTLNGSGHWTSTVYGVFGPNNDGGSV